MKRIILNSVFCLLFFLTSAAFADTHESIATGNWSAVTTWDSNPNPVPVNGDTVNINSPHVVTFDVDMTGWANGVTLTIDAGATLICKTTAGTYYLMTSADITHNGTLQAGTSVAVPLPITATFTIDFNSTANSIECDGGGIINFYCTEPTTKFVKLDAQSIATDTTLEVDTDVTGDIWAVGDEIEVSEGAGVNDTESHTINNIAAGVITLDAGLAAQKEIDSFIALVTRNIRIINSTGIAIQDVDGSVINCAIYDCTHGIDGSATGGNTIGGAIKVNEASGTALKFIYSSTINAAVAGSRNGLSYCYDCVFSDDAVNAGCYYGCLYSHNMVLRGNWCGSYYPVFTCGSIVLSCEHFKGYASAIYATPDVQVIDTIFDTGTQAMVVVTDLIANGCTFQNNARDITSVKNGKFFNCTFASGTEFYNYNAKTDRGKWNYVESSNHDGVTNAYKAWCVGGIVTSATADPPTDYDIYYSHACESASYPCFRQYEATVLPGTAIEVSAQIRLADGDDHTAFPPALQIMDKFADELIDSTQTPLDEDEVAVPNGTTNHDWQTVDCIWANTGDGPRQVIVRVIAQHATGVVEEAWSVAGYQDQIQTLYDDWADGGRLDLIQDAILVDTGTTLDAYIEEIIERLKRIWAYP